MWVLRIRMRPVLLGVVGAHPEAGADGAGGCDEAGCCGGGTGGGAVLAVAAGEGAERGAGAFVEEADEVMAPGVEAGLSFGLLAELGEGPLVVGRAAGMPGAALLRLVELAGAALGVRDAPFLEAVGLPGARC